MNKNSIRVILAFTLGQAAQVVLSTVAHNNYMARPTMFCIAAGVILLAAVIMGTRIAAAEQERPKSYMDWAIEEQRGEE